MTVTDRDAVEAFLLRAIVDPNGSPTAALHAQAQEHGITPQDIKEHGRRLRITTSWCAEKMTGLQRGPCIACGQSTPYAEPDHRLACCPGCTSPITTWRWRQPVPGRSRKHQTVTVAHRPGAWPSNEGLSRSATCNSIFVRRGSDRCREPVVWRVSVADGRTTSTSWWCDTDLPTDRRPPAPEPHTPGLEAGG